MGSTFLLESFNLYKRERNIKVSFHFYPTFFSFDFFSGVPSLPSLVLKLGVYLLLRVIRDSLSSWFSCPRQGIFLQQIQNLIQSSKFWNRLTVGEVKS